MFSSSLSRALAATLLLGIVAGCATPFHVGTSAPQPVASTATLALERWINLYTQTQDMTAEQASTRVAELAPPESSGQRFYYGLLHSQLDNYPDWIRARDAFAKLAADKTLTIEQRGLADVLRSQNQTRINAYVKQIDLQQRTVELQKLLVSAETEKTELQQKIQALTDLETSISTKKEE